MNQLVRQRLRTARVRVTRMIAERDAHGDPSQKPSRYWADFCSYFDYMFGLPDEAFERLRLHTYHLTGDSYQRYYFGDADAFWETERLDDLARSLPPELVINEPPGGIGHRYPSGRFVSADTLRYQRVLGSLYRAGVISQLRELPRPRLLEVGGGYGGLAHHLSAILGQATYVIVDLPETLLFSTCYTIILNPEKRIYVYDKGDWAHQLRQVPAGSFDFVFVPDYLLDDLRAMGFDLAINVASLQEMRQDQAQRYLEFIQATASVFYSWNQDCQPRNRELINLTELIEQRFSIEEVQETAPPATVSEERNRFRTALLRGARAILSALRAIARRVGLLEPQPVRKPAPAEPPYREYICRPRTTFQGDPT
jgi:putative sugar O-methyltransferase